MPRSLDAHQARQLARLGGILYLVIIAIGTLGEAVVRGSVVVPNDPGATAANLRSLTWLWRLGIAGELVLLMCSTGLALILYMLLRPAGRDLARLAILFNVVVIAVEAAAAASLAAALVPVSSAGWLAAIPAPQLDLLAYLSIRSHTIGFAIMLAFFGVECVILGVLIRRSRYMPAPIGVLMAIAGVCYVVNTFALLLSPPLSRLIVPTILLPPLIGELSLALWLLVRGVRADEWERRAWIEV